MRQRRIESDTDLVAATTTAGGTIPLCGSEKWNRTRTSLPLRPLQAEPFFFAATKVRICCGPRCRYDCSRRAILYRHEDCAASIRKSRPEIKNRCTKEGLNGEKPASIPKSGLEIKNRCTQEGLNGEILASIRKSGPEIKNRCSLWAVLEGFFASIPKFGPEIKNRCRKQHIPSTRSSRVEE